MIRRDVLPYSALSLKKCVGKASDDPREDEDSTQIIFVAIFHGGGNHGYLVEFIDLIGMVVAGRTGMALCEGGKEKSKNDGAGAVEVDALHGYAEIATSVP